MADPKTGQLAQPEDFETPQPAEQPKPQDVGYVKTPRDIAREEMARRAQQRRERSDASFKVDTLQEDGTITPAVVEKTTEQPLPEPEPVETAPDTRDTSQVTEAERTAAESEQKTNKADSPSAEAPAAPEQERELIVDGRRIRVPVSRILDAGVRTLQKESAADMRLAAATELLRTAQERQVQQQAPAQAPSDEDALLARQIQFGTEEEAKAAIARLRNAAPAITPQQIDAYVQQKLSQAIPEHAAFNEANSWLRTEYKQISEDPDLKFLFDVKEDQARRSGDRRP